MGGTMKATKQTCEAFAVAHDLNFCISWNASFFDRGWEYEISIPEGMLMMDGTTGRSLNCGEIPKAQVWSALLQDMHDCVQHEWVQE
jgi:hypothetical protein